MAKVIVQIGGKAVDEVPLDKKITVIGRESKCDIYLKNPSVSREHAKIIKHGSVFFVEDIKSTNGTFVNGAMVNWRSGLNNNDKIGVGKYTLVFKETEKGEKKEPKKLMPEFMDETIRVKKK
ncbi:MAG: FHA domain-containing protein [Nitrospirota bacterium]|nr:MAG: FHA domain-containing protein [Nitrospirota bacterium]